MADRDDYGYERRGGHDAYNGYVYQGDAQRCAARYAPAPAPAPRSAMGITGFVLGIVALLTSAIPVVNNASFFLALLGAVFAIVGLVAGVRGTRSGKGLSIAGLIVSIVAIVVVIVSQAVYSAAINSAAESLKSGAAVTSTSTGQAAPAAAADAAASSEQPSEQAASTDLAPGTSVQLEGGLSISVDAVRTDLVNYDGSQITGVTVTYANNGTADASFNVYDWKSQDASGVQQYNSYYSGEEGPALGSGTLAPGGTVSGMLFFSGQPTKVLYYSSLIARSPSASWTIS